MISLTHYSVKNKQKNNNKKRPHIAKEMNE